MSCETCVDRYTCRGPNCLTATSKFKNKEKRIKIIDSNKNGIRRERVVHKKVNVKENMNEK